MPASDGRDPEGRAPIVTALRASRERVVFTENGNKDGWISSDTTVELGLRR